MRAPRLPGHGTTWQDLATTGSRDWYATAEQAFTELSGRCEQVFVTGISMGACLAFRLAETQGAKVSGLVVVNPSLAPDTRLFVLAPVLKHVIVSVKAIGGRHQEAGRQRGRLPARPAQGRGHAARAVEDSPRGIWPAVTQPVLRVPVYGRSRGGAAEHAGAHGGTARRRGGPLADSYHVATLDNDAPAIFDGTLAFIKEHTAAEKRV